MAQDKLSKTKVTEKHSTSTSANSAASSGPSPFKGRKSDHDMMMSSSTTSPGFGSSGKKPEQESVTSRRKSFLPASAVSSGGGDEKSPVWDDTAETDDVLRRSGGGGRGLGGDILKEMKVRQEMKRASFVPKTEHSAEKESKGLGEESKPFANVFLR